MTAPATCRFKSHYNETAELFREDGGPWRVGAEGTDWDLTPAQARLIAEELIDAAEGASAMNAPYNAPSLDGRDVLVIKTSYSGNYAKTFSDGKPKRVVRMTDSSRPNYELVFPISDASDDDYPHTVTEGRGKNREVRTYNLLGRYELIATGTKDEAVIVVARIDD